MRTPTDAKRAAGVISLIGGYRGTPSPLRGAILIGMPGIARRDDPRADDANNRMGA